MLAFIIRVHTQMCFRIYLFRKCSYLIVFFLCSVFWLQFLRCCQCSSNPSMPPLTIRSQSPLLASPPDLLTLWSPGTGTFAFFNTQHWSLTRGSETYLPGEHLALISSAPPKMDGCKQSRHKYFTKNQEHESAAVASFLRRISVGFWILAAGT